MQNLLDYLNKEKSTYINKINDVYYDGKVTLIDDFIEKITQYKRFSDLKRFATKTYKWIVISYATEASEDMQEYLKGGINLMHDLRNKFFEIKRK